mmetsp:Transcript_61231/g.189614  ORF Transcript_61231/g.189614 Transcript_61231/m.189614 type:complete len:319 (+) Transcript_61231:1212-2168(+)
MFSPSPRGAQFQELQEESCSRSRLPSSSLSLRGRSPSHQRRAWPPARPASAPLALPGFCRSREARRHHSPRPCPASGLVLARRGLPGLLRPQRPASSHFAAGRRLRSRRPSWAAARPAHHRACPVQGRRIKAASRPAHQRACPVQGKRMRASSQALFQGLRHPPKERGGTRRPGGRPLPRRRGTPWLSSTPGPGGRRRREAVRRPRPPPPPRQARQDRPAPRAPSRQQAPTPLGPLGGATRHRRGRRRRSVRSRAQPAAPTATTPRAHQQSGSGRSRPRQTGGFPCRAQLQTPPLLQRLQPHSGWLAVFLTEKTSSST